MREKIIVKIKEHYGAFILSLVAGLVMLGPQLFFMYSLGPDYKGVYMMKSDGESYYLSRMKGFYDGDGINNPYYFENKNDLPNIYFTYIEGLLATPSYVTGISVAKLNLLYKFLFPAIVFLLVYFLSYRLSKRKAWSLAGASLVLMGNLLLSLPDLLHLFRLETVYSQFSLFSRPVNPEFSSIVFFSYLHLVLSAIQSGKRKWYIAMTLLFGASFYFYFYSWTFIFIMNASLAIALFFHKDFRAISWKLVLVTVGGLLLGMRAIVELLSVKTHPFLAQLAGVYDIATREPVVSTAGVFVTLFFVWYFWKQRPREKEDYFLLGLLIATFVDVNQQIITGISLQRGHYHWYFNIPIFIIMLVYLAAKRLDGIFSKNLTKVVALLIILTSIFSASFVQYSTYINHKKEVTGQQDFAQVFDWLNVHTSRNSVVMANESMSELIPVYTSNGVFDNYYGGTYLLSPLRRAYTNDLALKDLHIGNKLPFRLDYIVWNSDSDPEWRIDTIKTVKKEAVFGNLQLYRLVTCPQVGC